MRKLVPILILMLVISLWPGKAHANYYWNMFTGQNAYKSGNYGKAEESFVKALKDRPDDPAALYNMGSTYIKMDKLKEAAAALNKAVEVGNKNIQAKSEYNLGDISFQNKKLDESLKHYINAVDLAPDDVDAKYNIQVVQELLKKQKQKQQQQQKQQQKQQQQNKEKNKEEKKKEEQKNQKQKEQEQKEKQQQKQNQQQPKEQKEKMSKEDAMRLLRYYEQKEKMEKANRRVRVQMPSRTEEDW